MKLKIDDSKVKMMIVIALVTVVFYCVYRNCILTSDDYRYMFSRFDGTLVTNLKGAWHSFVAEYLNWSGRLAHLWDILLLLSKGELWRVLTPLLLACMPFLLFYFYALRLPKNINDYLKIAICFGLMTTFSDLYTVQMLYWHTACVTYFYMPMAMIVFLIPFRKVLDGNLFTMKKWLMPVACFLAFCLGMSQEVVGAITVAFIAFTIIYQLLRKEKIEWIEIILFVCALVGFVLLVFSPGNAIRQSMPTFNWWTEASLIGKIRHGLGQFIYNQYHAQNWIISALIMLLSLNVRPKNRDERLLVFGIGTIVILLLTVFSFGDSWMRWEFLEKWKYTQNYFNLENIEVFLPILVYGLITGYLMFLSVILSIQKRNIIYFLVVSAIICSNLTVLFSSVGTSYISFPGVMLTLGMIMYSLPNFKNNACLYAGIGLCFVLFVAHCSNEAAKAAITHQEEAERIYSVSEAVASNQLSVTLKCYTYRVWEGNVVSEEFRKYYEIPMNLAITFVEE